MTTDHILLLYILLFLCVMLLFLALKRISKVKVWIRSSAKPGAPLHEIGYLEMGNDGAAGEVKLSGGGSKSPIGIVIIDSQSVKDRGYVRLVTTDIEDESTKPQYRQVGYVGYDQTLVDEFGIVYKQVKGTSKKEVVGYLARPSKPHTPTLVGERSWKTLWLVSRLNAYVGKPNPAIDEMTAESQKTKNDKAKDDEKPKTRAANRKVECLVLNDDAGKIDEEEEQKTVTDDATSLLAETVSMSELEKENSESSENEKKASDNSSTEEPIAPESENLENSESEKNASDNALSEQSSNTEDASEPIEEESAKQKTQDKKRKKKDQVKPLAEMRYTGFHSFKKDELPAEARAGAYALLYQKFPRKKFAEYYKDRPYGWRDTALLTSFIYTLIFLLVYIINTGIMKKPLLGNDWIAVLLLSVYYFVLWAIVRMVKIDRIEYSNSFQPKLDLFNKNLSLGFMNWTILVFGLLALYFTYSYYDFDFMPLIAAIMIGVGVNMGIKAANRRWVISSTYLENDDIDDEEDEDEEPKNPEGDISRTYEWKLDPKYGDKGVTGSVTLYFNASYVNDIRQSNPFFAQRKDKKDKEYILDMFNMLKEHKSLLSRVKYIVYTIDRIVEQNAMTPIDKLQFTLDFVQEPNIMFRENKDCPIVNYYDDYIRYPDETLYDKEGDSNSKSLLAAMLFHVMGYNVLYLASRKNQHSAIGVEVNPEDLQRGWYGNAHSVENITLNENGKHYIYCETTGDNFTIGSGINGMSVDDFDEKVVLPVNDEEEETEELTRIYNWELDSESGKTLKGNYMLNFNEEEMEMLRQVNPFQGYGESGNTSYENNVKTIFSYLFAEESRMEKVQEIADYIRESTKDSKFNELDTLQFALDFVQEPNIKYCVDEKSSSIEYAKEYMRFPDEVLFDKEGDCDCKSSLTVALFHCLGYNVIFMISDKLGHAAIGVEASANIVAEIEKLDNSENVVREYNGKKYLYCESTGDGYRVGHIKDDFSIKDFETIVEIPV